MATPDGAQDQVGGAGVGEMCMYVMCILFRECVTSLEGLGLPEKAMTILHQLAMNVRSLCMDTLFQCASKGTYIRVIPACF